MHNPFFPHNFTIIAIRILPHCRDYIRKCLRENELYYLNTNYKIQDGGIRDDTIIIKPRQGYAGNIDDRFFELDDAGSRGEASHPNMSISAIVGKNGDGKSTLTELIIRLINNFAYDSALNPNRQLIYVDGVYGEIYYRLNSRFFMIRISKEEKEDYVNVYEFIYDSDEKGYVKGDALRSKEVFLAAFYTLVSNYSHFAYNTEEFSDEDLPDAVGGHWLQRIFHKNDAYQTPLNIHPYRDKGNIDINRERLLSIQRMLISITTSFRKGRNGKMESSYDINSKYPYELRLKDIGISKLQKVTLAKYLEDNRDINIIEREIEAIRESVMRDGYDTDWNITPLLADLVGTSLTKLGTHYLTKRFLCFMDKAVAWGKKNHLLGGNTDFSQLFDIFDKLENRRAPRDTYISDRMLRKWEKIKNLNALQFLRLCLVYDICRMWNSSGLTVSKNQQIRLSFNPDDIFKDYKDMSNAEKCCHYIIYKTIEIFNTYPSYGDPLKNYVSPESFLSINKCDFSHGTLFDLTSAFERLSKDWSRKSHNTLKLRQTYSLLRGYNSSKKLYASVSPYKGKTIIFERISEADVHTLSDIETLPPPIFEWEILFRKKNEENLIPFRTFSSGEKQKQFFLSAITYHLQNLNSIGAEKIRYDAVNLIFEEIELYFHPEWQRTLIFDLIKSIRVANLQNIHSLNMIFVTHSPYILSDIPKSNVLFLKDGAPSYETQENTFGANINSLLKNGFFLPSLPIGEFAYRKINTLFEQLHSGDFDPREIDTLYAQIMTVGEPAIRMQLMSLFASYRRLILKDDEIEAIIRMKTRSDFYDSN